MNRIAQETAMFYPDGINSVPGQNISLFKLREASQGEEFLSHLSLHLPLECLRQLELLQAPRLRQNRCWHLEPVCLLVLDSHHQLAFSSTVGCFPPFQSHLPDANKMKPHHCLNRTAPTQK